MSFETLSPFLIASILAATLLVALAVWWLMKPRAPKRRAQGGTATQPALPLRLLTGMAQQLTHLLAGLRTLAQRREWRYRAPWILLLGQTGSGRSSLAASGGESRRDNLSSQEAGLAVAGSSFVYFERGLLIDLDKEIAPDSQDPEPRLAWSRVVAGLFDRRPERPLDGVILTLSARTLIQGNAAQLRSLAERQYGQLLELQRRFEFTFPVYVVVTQCDAIEGFAPFWSRQDPALLQQINGWSNPYALDSSFLPAWVDEAFAHLGRGLKTLQLQAAAQAGGSPEEVDRFFLFPQRMNGLHHPLRQVLEGIFKGSAFHANFFMRGLYFTGAVAGNGALEDGPRDDVAFIPSLLEDKVFAETNLARATRQGVLSRHTLIRRLQLGTVVAFALLCAWLAFDANRLAGQVDQTIGAIDMVKDHKVRTQQGNGRCIGKAQSYALQEQIALISAQLTYPTIPASWFDHRHEGSVSKKLSEEAFQQVIFPDLRCQLEARARDLLRDPTPPDPQRPAAAAAEGWQHFLLDRATQVADFERHASSYRQVVHEYASDDAGPLLTMYEDLATYLYGEPLPVSVNNPNGLFLKTLVEVDDDPAITLPDHMKLRIAQGLLRWGGMSQQGLLRLVDRGGEDLETLRRDKGVDTNTINDFTAWLGWIQSDWLGADSQHNPCLSIAQGLAPPLKSLKGLGYSVLELDQTAELFSNERCLQPAQTRLEGVDGPANTPLLIPRDGQLVLAAGAQHERDRLAEVTDLDFMRRQTAPAMVCRAPLRGWDDGKLREMLAAIRSFDRFLTVAGKPEPPPTLAERLARRQLAGVVNDLLTQAQTPVDLAWEDQVAVSPLAALEGEVRQEGSDFGRAKEDLVMLIATLRQHGLERQAAQLTQCARDFAGDVLSNIESLAAASHLYRVHFNPVDAGDPDETLLADLGTPPQAQEMLDRQLQRAQVLGGYATPFVNFLLNSEQVDDAHRSNKETAAYWSNTITELNRFVQFKEPNGQVAHLNDWVIKQLLPMTLGACTATLTGYNILPQGNDLFSLHRATLERQAASLCKEHKQVALDAGYQALAHAFNQTLAGRFPFGPDPKRPAALLATKQFFLDYAPQRQTLHQEIAAMKGERWRQAASFLNQLDAVADFLASNLTNTPGSQPLTLHTTFRTYDDGTPAWHISDQLITWRLRSGQELSIFPGAEQELTWSFGQSVALELDWAERSPLLPKVDPAQGDLHIDGPRATFIAEGPWALLNLIATHTPTTRPPSDPLDPTTLALAFEVPIHRPEGDAGVTAGRMFLALQLLGSDPTGKTMVPLTLPPLFPYKAPLAW